MVKTLQLDYALEEKACHFLSAFNSKPLHHFRARSKASSLWKLSLIRLRTVRSDVYAITTLMLLPRGGNSMGFSLKQRRRSEPAQSAEFYVTLKGYCYERRESKTSGAPSSSSQLSQKLMLQNCRRKLDMLMTAIITGSSVNTMSACICILKLRRRSSPRGPESRRPKILQIASCKCGRK